MTARDDDTGPERSRHVLRQWGLIALAALLLLGPLVTLVVHRASARAAAPVLPAPVGSAPPSSEEVGKILADSFVCLERKRPMDCLADLERAAMLEPNNPDVHNNLCVAYGLLRRRDPAVAACRRAVALVPGFELAQNNLRWVLGIEPEGPP